MKQRPRVYYTKADKALMWDRWEKGESLNSIARLMGPGGARAVVAESLPVKHQLIILN